jgi:hypothetical protein
MLAPALVGVAVGTGTHVVVFTYHGFAWYPELFLLGGVVLFALFWVARRYGRRPHSGSTGVGDTDPVVVPPGEVTPRE